MLLVDTNAVSEFRKIRSNKANTGLVVWAGRTAPADMFVSAITLMEVEQGILLIERRDKPQGNVMRRWFDDRVLGPFKDRMLPVDAAVALRAAALHVPDRSPSAIASSPRRRSSTE